MDQTKEPMTNLPYCGELKMIKSDLFRFSGILLLIWVILAYIIKPTSSTMGTIDIVIGAFHMPGIIICLAVTYWMLVKQNKMNFITIIASFSSVIIGVAINIILTNMIDFSNFIGFYFVSPFSTFNHFLLLIPVYLLGVIYFYVKKYRETIELERSLNKLKSEKDEINKQLFKAQIQPHFLFNALNTLYALARKNDPKTSDSIIKLSELLRFSVDSFEMEKITIKEEFDFLNKYIQFQLLRNPNHAEFAIKLTAEDDSEMIPALLFQPLIENIFKHGDITKEVNINYHISSKRIEFYAENFFHGERSTQAGKGIELVKNRLNTLYPNQFIFDEKMNNEHTFTIKCEIKL